MQLINNFKKGHPVLFWILLPILILLAVLGAVGSAFLSSTKDDMREANIEDAKLKAEADKANAAANVHKANADKIENEIGEIKDDENWDI